MHKPLTNLKRREYAEIVSFECGQMLCNRLEGMGIRLGKIITRINAPFMSGKVIVLINGHQVALGRGMAEKILVKPMEADETGKSL
ncbi:MAG: FeoA family protein [Balneolales bacterium]